MLANRPCLRSFSLLATLALLLLLSGLGRAGTPPASVLYVDAALGADVSGGGAPGAPLRTIGFALSQSTGLAKPVEVRVAAGVHDAALGEVFPLFVPARVRIVGAGVGKTVVAAASATGAFQFDASGTGGLPYTADAGLARLTLTGLGTGVEVQTLSSPAARPELRELELIGFETGIYVLGWSSPAEPSLSDLFFDACGTGIDLRNLNTPQSWNLSDARFQNCGIGLRASASGTPFANTDTVANRCQFEGCDLAVYATGSRPATIELLDSAILGGGDGCSAFGSFPASATIRLTRCTVAGNQRGLLGSTVGLGRFSLDHTIVWDNAVGYAFTGPFPEQEMQAVWSNLQPNWPGAFDASNFELAPLFVDPQGLDYRLSALSPLVDLGSPTAPQVGIDLDIQPRLVDGDGDLIVRLDIGAYEYNPVGLAVSGNAVLGGVLDVDVTSPVGWLELVFAGFAPADIPLGGLGSLLLDPVGLTMLPQGALLVPNQPALLGLELYLQAAGIETATTAGATSRRVRFELR
ncbi:MAG: DUF1565 domain-containing protein [Planctomycetaceae bacterium]|nr:DUF1565 domain-containing protein [Planctomycetaceae bacterium]